MPDSPPKAVEESARTSLAAPAEIAVPSTPTPSRPTLSLSPDHNSMRPGRRPSHASPPPPSSSLEITPPPSSQNLIDITTLVDHTAPASSRRLASPPGSVDKTLCVAYGASENLPTSADINNADGEHLRKLATDLLAVAQEYRMSASHFKLQHSLLSLTSSEAVKRAEVEQQLARREVEILQSEEYRNRKAVTAERSPQPSGPPPLDDTMDRMKELEQSNATLERRLHRAKRLIEENNDKYELLLEENSRLKKRIRDNREHFTLMLDHGSLSSSPRTEFVSPRINNRSGPPCSESNKPQIGGRVGNQDPFAALLAADQVLSRDPGSVPSTPARIRDQKTSNGHSRNSHSLSSLPLTPAHRTNDDTGQKNRFASPAHKRYPTFQAHEVDRRDRQDRDSTISASDAEEALTDEDVPASQASSLATSMLRRHPGSSQDEPSVPANIGKSSTLLQSKLFGHVKKAGIELPGESNLKRRSSVDDGQSMPAKKAKVRESFGIGVSH